MPSDCQCSTACDCGVVTKVINNKEATKRLKRLEKEVEDLKEENIDLKRRLKRANINKKKIVNDLKNRLDRM